jgi:hypothetical protein
VKLNLTEVVLHEVQGYRMGKVLSTFFEKALVSLVNFPMLIRIIRF